VIFGDRFKSLRKAMGKNQEEFSIMVGTSRPTIYRIEKNESEIGIDILQKLNQNSVNIEWLLTGEGEMFRNVDTKSLIKKEENIEYYSMPYIDITASAGFGIENFDEIYDESNSLYIGKDFFPPQTSLQNTFCIRACGDSMEPNIRNGDFLIVRKMEFTPSISYTGTCVVCYQRELLVKNIQLKENGLKLISTNPLYDPIFLEGTLFNCEQSDIASDFRIIGEVSFSVGIHQISFDNKIYL